MGSKSGGGEGAEKDTLGNGLLGCLRPTLLLETARKMGKIYILKNKEIKHDLKVSKSYYGGRFWDKLWERRQKRWSKYLRSLLWGNFFHWGNCQIWKQKLSIASNNLHRHTGTQIGIWCLSKRGGFGGYSRLQLDSEGLHIRKKNKWEIDKPLLEPKSSSESAESLTAWKWSASSLTAGQMQKEI